MNAKILKIISAFGIMAVLLGLTGVSSVAAEAEIISGKEKFPLDYYALDYCTGELVHWTGYVQYTYRNMFINDGDNHYQLHARSKQTGTGTESGQKYEFISNAKVKFKLKEGDPPWVYSETSYRRAVAQGEGPVLMVKTVYVIEAYPSGESVAVKDEYRYFCATDDNPSP